MSNAVCRNFNYNENPDGILALLSLNCDKCEFDSDCAIKAAYHEANEYSKNVFDQQTIEPNEELLKEIGFKGGIKWVPKGK